MKDSSTELNDLPDEILIIILKKLFNTDVLYSLIDINERFNTIVHDPIFTSHLTLTKCFSDNSNYPLPDPILDRFCLQILPSIEVETALSLFIGKIYSSFLAIINY